MGCDIHLMVEEKRHGIWLYSAVFNIDRSYTTFEKLAGVRGNVSNAIVPPRGWPQDRWTTQEYTEERYAEYFWMSKCDLHTPSWLSIEEFARAIDGAIDDYQRVLAYCQSLKNETNEVRIVFAFDN